MNAAGGHYATVERAIRFLAAHQAEQPGLPALAAAVGLSEFHLQRVFAEWAGISPKRFLQVLTKAHAREQLLASRSVLSAAWEAGLSGGGRLHDLFVECEAVTPGEVKALGSGLGIVAGFAATPFGTALLGWTARGVCHLRFVDGDADTDTDETAAALAELHSEWPAATHQRDDDRAAELARQIFESGVGGKKLQVADASRSTPLPWLDRNGHLRLWVQGTNFQIQVWQALLRLPEASVCTYGELAERLGRHGSARAIGNAVGKNPVGWLIPCHRVIRETGALGGYRWGLARKQAMLVCEPAPTAAA